MGALWSLSDRNMSSIIEELAAAKSGVLSEESNQRSEERGLAESPCPVHPITSFETKGHEVVELFILAFD